MNPLDQLRSLSYWEYLKVRVYGWYVFAFMYCFREAGKRWARRIVEEDMAKARRHYGP